MAENLYAASNQWATRPADQRFATLAELYEATNRYRESARTALVPYADLSIRPSGADGADLELVGRAGTPAKLTHWAFGQLSRNAGAPADYLRSLPAELACRNLSYGLAKNDGSANLLIHSNGSLVVRSATSDKYSRIWDSEVVRRLLPFTSEGWVTPPARPAQENAPGARIATEQDCGPHTLIRPGEWIAPAGLYASDHDLFVFLVNPERRLNDGTDGGLSRGFFVSNSEVGAAALKVVTFMFRHVCGNHIVWGAESAQELRIVHRGNADERFGRELAAEIRRYSEQSAGEDEQRIRQAQTFSLGTDKETVLDALFAKLRTDGLSRKVLDSAYTRAELDSNTDRTIDPRTAWGMVQGLTAQSQDTPYMDERARIDRAAGKVLAMAF